MTPGRRLRRLPGTGQKKSREAGQKLGGGKSGKLPNLISCSQKERPLTIKIKVGSGLFIGSFSAGIEFLLPTQPSHQSGEPPLVLSFFLLLPKTVI